MYKFSNKIYIKSSIEEVFQLFSSLKVLNIFWDYVIKDKNNYLYNNKDLNEVKVSLIDNESIELTIKFMDVEENKYFSILNKKNGANTIYRYEFFQEKDFIEVRYTAEIYLEKFQEELANQIFEIIKEDDLNHLEKLKFYLEK